MLIRIHDDKVDANAMCQYIYEGKPFQGITYKVALDGKIVDEAAYFYGLKWVLFRGWYPNGQLEYDRPMRNGGDEGLGKIWYPNGVLQKEFFSEFGVRIWTKEWDESGKLIKDWILPEDGSHPSYRYLQSVRSDYVDYEKPPELVEFEQDVAAYIVTHPSNLIYYEKDFLQEQNDLIIQL
ncbi:hypothetical protein Cri9333_0640 [Crinalium epipsammum PCC 9333]|uniref:MORN variant repeat-containing protein n=1 Tax=Crinalium epipsammum PCC 9333 TaxID=1173022 RepID=K9VU18_9CYAN|nr:hypothetical protein [Crinalium epipsammum]AFZ11583.1 hypothetical protein Cri9333_0640 [Crinalium epipsammum PCC 9333]